MFRHRAHTKALKQLRGLSPLRCFTDRELRIIDGSATGLYIEAGRILCRQGEVRREFLIMTEGAVALTRYDQATEQLGPEETFHELAPIGLDVWSADVTTIVPSDVLAFTLAEFATLLERVPRLGRLLVHESTTRTSDAGQLEISEQVGAIRAILRADIAR